MRWPKLPSLADGLKLHRLGGDELIACETVTSLAVEIGPHDPSACADQWRVEIGGDLKKRFAEIIEDDGTWSETVALYAGSYKALMDRT